jgi:hypothetical protein
MHAKSAKPVLGYLTCTDRHWCFTSTQKFAIHQTQASRTHAKQHVKMRLRLTIQRNSLPDANILWSIPETNSSLAYTITRLLEDVNHIIPLEAEHWGLEHYVVEVGGFECLHFMPVVNALKEDDHVSYVFSSIRLMTANGF